jgi:exonuclease VII small subunit
MSPTAEELQAELERLQRRLDRALQIAERVMAHTATSAERLALAEMLRERGRKA